jgi:predicted GNAT family acetyltransferase
MAPTLQRFATVEGFLAVTQDFLVQRESEHNLMLGICDTLMSSPGVYKQEPYLAAMVDHEHVVGAAVRTPPWELLLSEIDDARAVDLVVQDRSSEVLPGVTGPSRMAARFADLWSKQTGTPVRLAMQERAFVLAQVRHPRLAPGRMRKAQPSDRALLRQWLEEFVDEALAGHHPSGDLDALAERWAAGEQRTMQLWMDNGLPVSMAGVGARTPNGVRIGPVYTPRDLRGRGYASNLVAGACTDALAGGSRLCFLFTDLANPTSNHIYQDIGFEPVTDIDRWAFGEAGQP